jgi:ubiquitin carboxyl-terminal hydrolase 4/11
LDCPPSSLLRRFSTKAPRWVDPRAYLEPELQNLFTLSYYGNGLERIPSGWDAPSDNEYPRLSSRAPAPADSPESQSSEGDNAAAGTDDSSGEEAASRQVETAITSMNDETGDEDEDRPWAQVVTTLSPAWALVTAIGDLRTLLTST